MAGSDENNLGVIRPGNIQGSGSAFFEKNSLLIFIWIGGVIYGDD